MHALIVGGENPEEAKKYTFHGGKRANISFQKSFGAATDKEVALGSKHAVKGKGMISEYTDANKCQLAEASKRQIDVRGKMGAIIEAKKRVEGGKRTTKKRSVPGEVKQNQNYVSPSDVR